MINKLYLIVAIVIPSLIAIALFVQYYANSETDDFDLVENCTPSAISDTTDLVNIENSTHQFKQEYCMWVDKESLTAKTSVRTKSSSTGSFLDITISKEKTKFIELDLDTQDKITGVWQISINGKFVDDYSASVFGNMVVLNHDEYIETAKVYVGREISRADEIYMEKCDPAVHKKEVSDRLIFNGTHKYNLQYCVWQIDYPVIEELPVTDKNQYCADVFGMIMKYYQDRNTCGIEQVNEDGTPRGVCEPPDIVGQVFFDEGFQSTNCVKSYQDWAYLTESNDHIWYLMGQDFYRNKITESVVRLEPDENTSSVGNEPATPNEVIKSIALDNIPYQKLIEDEQEYVGQMLRYYGKISNVDNNKFTDSTAIIAVTPAAGWVDPIELTYNNFKLTDDTFKRVWGTYTGINELTGLPMIQVFIVQ